MTAARSASPARAERALAAAGWEAACALGLLSVMPLPAAAHRRPGAITLAAFPAVGALLGGILAGLDAGLAPVLGVPVRSALLVAALAGLSGGLHLDGLADTADGLAAGGTAQRRLEVMADSRTGAVGAAAVSLVLIVDTVALAGIATQRLQAVVAAAVASRAAAAVALAVSGPARTTGLGVAFAPRRRGWAGVAAVAVSGGAGWALASVRGGVSAAVAVGVALAVSWVFACRVGGMTGDGCGAVVELALTGSLVCLGAR